MIIRGEMMSSRYDALKLSSQLCFPLYAGARRIVQKYTPYLNELGITYTQYVTLMVLWEKKKATVGELTEALYLDTGTMTPLLKKMQAGGLISKKRSKKDERTVEITLTEKGTALREKALSIPKEMRKCIDLSPAEASELYRLLYKILDSCS